MLYFRESQNEQFFNQKFENFLLKIINWNKNYLIKDINHECVETIKCKITISSLFLWAIYSLFHEIIWKLEQKKNKQKCSGNQWPRATKEQWMIIEPNFRKCTPKYFKDHGKSSIIIRKYFLNYFEAISTRRSSSDRESVQLCVNV